jgi:hypothetical protein
MVYRKANEKRNVRLSREVRPTKIFFKGNVIPGKHQISSAIEFQER